MKSKKIAVAALAGAGSLLMARSAAQAAISVTWVETQNVTLPAGEVGAGNTTAYDRYLFEVTSITGLDNVTGASGQDAEVLLWGGTWTGSGANSLLVPGAAANPGKWTSYITSGAGVAPGAPPTPSGYKSSYTNLPGISGTASRTGIGTATTTGLGSVSKIGGTSTSMTATWIQNNPGSSAGPAGGVEPSEQSGRLAIIYVLHGDSITFTGQYGTYQQVAGIAVTTPITVSTVPVVAGNNIVSLTSNAPTNTAPTAYGSSSLGTVMATGTGASYKVGTLVLGSATGTGYVNGVLNGTPTVPTEIYALDIESSGGGTTPPSDLSAIAAAMQTALVAQGFTGTTVSTGTPANNPFPAGPAGTPGYDVFITVAGATQAQLSSDFLGFDLTEGASTPFSTDKVAAVALVPEPTSAAFLLVGASGMLMGRRRRNASQTA